MKNIGTLLRKAVFSFGLLYGLNLIISSANLLLPINIISISTAVILGVPGILSLVALMFILK